MKVLKCSGWIPVHRSSTKIQSFYVISRINQTSLTYIKWFELLVYFYLYHYDDYWKFNWFDNIISTKDLNHHFILEIMNRITKRNFSSLLKGIKSKQSRFIRRQKHPCSIVHMRAPLCMQKSIYNELHIHLSRWLTVLSTWLWCTQENVTNLGWMLLTFDVQPILFGMDQSNLQSLHGITYQ